MSIRATLTRLALVSFLLASCGSDPGDAPLGTTLLATAKLLTTPKAAPAAPARVTRAQVVAAGVPLLRVRIPSRKVEVFLTRRDSNSGTESWATGDNTVLTLRDGVLISTRALTPDLMSAAVPSVAQLATPGGSHARSYFVLGANDTNQRLEFACTMASRGAVRLEVVELAYATTHMQETCTGALGIVVNDYWIEGRGAIRQSIQWTNPSVGHIEFARLAD